VLTSYTMVCMVLGYLVGVVAIPRYLSQQRALVLSGLAGILLTVGVALGSTHDSGLSQALVGWTGAPLVPNTVMCLALLGLANAMVWPAIWPLALQGLGRHTASGSAVLVMAIAGGALLPLLYGHLSDIVTPRSAYWLLLPCYALILWYAAAVTRSAAGAEPETSLRHRTLAGVRVLALLACRHADLCEAPRQRSRKTGSTGRSDGVASATKLQLRWELQRNLFSAQAPHGRSQAHLILTNRDSQPLPPQGWSLYFNCMDRLEPASCPAN
jgi:hypothetical protein